MGRRSTDMEGATHTWTFFSFFYIKKTRLWPAEPSTLITDTLLMGTFLTPQQNRKIL